MTEQECLAKMIAPGTVRLGKYRGGVIQIHVTRQCDKACFNCTQGSNYRGPYSHMSLENFEAAVKSLSGYWGVVGVFGGNPALHPEFELLCDVLQRHVPRPQRGLWCNNPVSANKAHAMRVTFNPDVSNLNVHLDRKAYELFKKEWPESRPFGLDKDSRHSPVFVAMRDVGVSEEDRWDLISRCDINQHWSAMMGQFRGQLRAWFCEIAGAQSILHQDDPNYPDTGIPILDNGDYVWAGTRFWDRWWQLPMSAFTHQVRKHCHECGVPLRGYGELAQAGPEGVEQYSAAHEAAAVPKRAGRLHQPVTRLEQLGVGRLNRTTDYLGNATR